MAVMSGLDENKVKKASHERLVGMIINQVKGSDLEYSMQVKPNRKRKRDDTMPEVDDGSEADHTSVGDADRVEGGSTTTLPAAHLGTPTKTATAKMLSSFVATPSPRKKFKREAELEKAQIANANVEVGTKLTFLFLLQSTDFIQTSRPAAAKIPSEILARILEHPQRDAPYGTAPVRQPRQEMFNRFQLG